MQNATTPAGDAVGWLAAAAPDPEACRRAWEADPLGVTLLPAGRRWDVLVVTGPLGPAALRVLRRLTPACGPVLGDAAGTRTGFLVPPGTSARWLGTGIRGAGRGSWTAVPHPARATAGVHWVVPPDGSGRLTDPRVLELALHEAAAEAVEADR
jgi:hypothetical protein